MDKNYQQAIRIGVVGGFVIAAILVILLTLVVLIANSLWPLYYFGILAIIGTAVVGVFSIRYGKATNNLLMTVASTGCLAGLVAGAVAMILIECVNIVMAFVVSGIQASLFSTIAIDLIIIVVFTLCAALTGALGGLAYSRLYVARLK
jgi:hypothetical protein